MTPLTSTDGLDHRIDHSATQGTTRHAHDDLASPEEMAADCQVVSRRLDAVARAARRPAPSIEYADYPREVRKREIEVSEAAARLAAALKLDTY